MRSRYILVGLLLSVGYLTGCGGGSGGGGSSSSPTPPPISTTRLAFSVRWGERSRAISIPSSALSVTLTLGGANAQGKDFTYTVNRDANTAASYTQSIIVPDPIRSGTFPTSIKCYSAPDGQGDIVGSTSTAATIKPDGSGIGDIALGGRVASVQVPTCQNVSAGQKQDLIVTCRDQEGALVTVSPGSLFYQVTAGQDFVHSDSGQLVGVSTGEATITATVDGKTSSPVAVTVTGGTAASADVVLLKDSVALVPADNSLTLSNVTENSLSLTGNLPLLTPGRVLVSRTGNGLIRKVLSTNTVGNRLDVQTGEATLADVFQQVQFTLEKDLADNDVIVTEANGSGAFVPSSFHFGSDYPLNRSLIGNSALTLNGMLRLTGKYHFSLQIQEGKLVEANGSGTLTTYWNGNWQCNAPLQNINTSIPLLNIVGKPQSGPFGIPITPTLTIACPVSGTFATGMTYAADITATMQSGATYSQGNTEPVGNLQKDVTITPLPLVRTTATGAVTPLASELNLSVGSLPVTTIQWNLPTMQAAYQLQAVPVGVILTGTTRVVGNATLRNSRFDTTVADYSPQGVINETLTPYQNTILDTGNVDVGVQ